MAKKVTGMIKLQVQAGKANPAPPIGPALGQHGVNIPGFCKEFNERTKNDVGLIIPVVITVYSDRSFTFITKTPPVPVLIKKALGLESGSGKPNKTKVGTITKAQIAETLHELDGLSDTELLDFTSLAKVFGYPTTAEAQDSALSPRGYRAMAGIPRLQFAHVDLLVRVFLVRVER